MMIWSAIMVLGTLAILFGLLLGYASVHFKVEGNPVVEQVDSVLPQLQCGKCGYPGCRPYAEAIVKGEAEINQCPPGGETGMLALARLLDRQPKPMESDEHIEKITQIAVIDEATCIGCTLCLQACPVDAILGAARCMHTVIVSECTGCELCVAPCPVNCIQMQVIAPDVISWKWPYPTFNISMIPKTAA